MKSQTEKNRLDIKKILHPTVRQDIFHPTRLLYAAVFAIIAMALPYYGSRIYLTYFDQTEYYKVIQPVEVDKEIYKPCEAITTTLVRTSFLNDIAHSTVQIYLVNVNSNTKFNPIYDGNIVLEKTNSKIIHTNYILPCNIPTGKFFIQAIVKYHIAGIEKSYLWVTKAFTVSKDASE